MKFYITTPIYYVNAEPHIGHAYSTLVADVLTRFRTMAGDDGFFVTGTDEHGDKIVEAAARTGITPKEYADRISGIFRATWPELNIHPRHFTRTTDSRHIKAVRHLLNQVYATGDIYFGEYAGLYCTGCERFLIERELVDGKCPDHHLSPLLVKEQNYFFRMSRYQEWLIDHIKNNPDFITPERYRNEVLSFLNEPLEDLCISRPRSRLDWGIPLPFDDSFVTYVWFDALINYISVLGYPDEPEFAKYWPETEHIIAKDILKPHAIYWPTMLKAAGIAPYQRLHVHGYWSINDAKMSKSLGNVVRPLDLTRLYGVDTVRYCLMREMVFGLDASFSEESLVARRNSDLANDLGNLFSRALTMVEKYCEGVVPRPGQLEEIDCDLRRQSLQTSEKYASEMQAFAFHKALAEVWETINQANKYIVKTSPWELAKAEESRERLDTVLYSLLETLRMIAIWLTPFLPDAANKMMLSLGYGEEETVTYADATTWGLLPSGQSILKGSSLFPRLAPEEPAATREKKSEEGAQAEAIDFSDFGKVDIRVGEVLAAEPVPKSEKLLKLEVLADRRRTIVAGIAKYYRPEELIGRKVVIVANLKPAKLMGVRSEGMVLAAKDADGLRILTVEGDIKPGSKVS